MCKKVIVVPNEKTEYVLNSVDVEILILNQNTKRLDIIFAPNLKKIISLGDLVFGPETLKADVPVLNKCENLNEILVFGDIKFNTMISVNGINKVCAWTGENAVPPTLTTIGAEYTSEFPCFFYNTQAPIESSDTALVYAYPTIRECPVELFDILFAKMLENPDEVTATKLYKRPTMCLTF